MDRKDVNIEDTWDLSKFYASNKEWFEDLEKVKKYEGKFSKYKGKLSNKQTLIKYLEESKQCGMLFDKLSMYVSNSLNVDLSNKDFNEMSGLLTNVATIIATEESFVEPELLTYDDEYLKSLIVAPELKNYAFWLKDLMKDKKHILSEKEEELLTGMSTFAGDSNDVFDSLTDVDFKFEDAVDSKGEKHELTQSSYGLLLRSKDRFLREDAFKKFYGKFKDFNNTIYTNYLTNLKADHFYCKARKFKSCLEQALYSNNIPMKMYEKLKEEVRANLKFCKQYNDLRRKALKLDNLKYYDLGVSICDDFDKKYTFSEAKSIALEALKPLGEDYLALVKQAFNDRWIDVYPTTNKISGGYEVAVYGFTPVILLNFVGTVSDVYTLVHETGHAIHSYFANTTQPYETSDYSIFLAEIASTFNEVLLTKYFLKTAKTQQEKLYFLDRYANLFNGTVFRQMAYSEFEEIAHSLVEKNMPISKEILNKEYYNLNATYDKGIENDELKSYHWSIVPHFYRSFYVFKYATGLISAVSLATMVLNGTEKDRERYFDMLRSGGKDYPTNILKKAGVDLSSNKPYDLAFGEYENTIKEMKKIIK